MKPPSPAPDFKRGDRIRLVAMGPDPDPVRPGTEGEIITDACTVFPGQWHWCVKWDDGRTLGLICPPDRAEQIS